MRIAGGAGLRVLGSLSLLSLLAVTGGSQSSRAPLGGLTELYPWPEDPHNRVSNPSFENRGRPDTPNDWEIRDSQSWSIDSSTRHSGRVSLRLSDSHRARFTPFAAQKLSLEPGWYSMRGFVKAERAGTQARGSGGRLTITQGGSRDATRVVSGSTDWIRVQRNNLAVRGGGGATLRIEAYRKPDGRLYFDDVAVHRLVPPLVEGFLLYPNYRGVLFEDASQTIQISVTLRPQVAQRSEGELLARVSLEAAGGTVIASSEEAIPANTPRTLSLDASKAPVGRHQLRIQAVHATTRASFYEYPPYTIVKMSTEEKSSLRTYVDADNVLVLEGERRFPLGIYDTSGRSAQTSYYAQRISRIAEGPFTLYLNYWLGGASRTEIEALTTALRQYGMSYIHTANAWYEWNPNWDGRTPCGMSQAGELGQAGFTACKAQELGDLRGMVGWYTADERPVDNAAIVFEQYRLLRDNDPDGITFIAQNRPRELVRWRDAADVMGVDPYPIVNTPEGQLSPLEMVRNWTRDGIEAVEGSRPLWVVIQFFQNGARSHWPTYEELRTMSYMAIIAGARGLFYWSYGARALDWVQDPAKQAEYWKRLVRVTQEIGRLEPVLVAPDSASVLQSVSESNRIDWRAKELNGQFYVFAVNHTRAHVEATLSLARDASRVEVLEENRSINVSGRTFRDSFRPYEVHVYRFR